MARLLVRLKLRLLANTLQRGGAPALGLVMSALFGLLAGGWGFWLLSTVPTEVFWADVVVIVYASIWAGWLLLPAMTFSADETLDPRRFALLPVTRRALVTGLLGAGFVGVGPVGTLLAASGAAVAAGRLSGSVGVGLLAGLAAVLLLAVAVTWSRAVLTFASHLLASRRGRDLVALLGVVVGLTVWAVLNTADDLLVPNADPAQTADLSGPAAVARWTPGGLAGVAVVTAARGEVVGSLAALLGVVAWMVVGLTAWALALRRVQSRAVRSAAGGSGTRGRLYPVALGWLPRNRTTAVAVRFLRGLVRDARVRTQALMHIVLVLPVLGLTLGAGALRAEWSPMMTVLVVVPFGMLAANQVGLDGPALWLHEVAGARPMADLLGRTLGMSLAAMPVLLVVAVALAAFSGGWAYLPAAMLSSVAALAAVLGSAAIAAVLVPAPVPDEPENVFGSSEAGQGCLGSMMMLVTLVVQVVLLMPVLVSLRLVETTGARTAVSALALLYGAAVLFLSVRLAAARLTDRGPELLAAVDPRRA